VNFLQLRKVVAPVVLVIGIVFVACSESSTLIRGPVRATPLVHITESPWPPDELQVVLVNQAGKVLHGIRHANATWTQFDPIPGTSDLVVRYVATANVNGELLVVLVTTSSQALFGIRHADEKWSSFGTIPGTADVNALMPAVASVNGELQVVLTTNDHQAVHGIRHADGTWTTFDPIPGLGNLWGAQFTAAAGVNGELLVIIRDTIDRPFYGMRDANDNWTSFKPIPGTGANSGFDVGYPAAASVNGELHVVFQVVGGQLLHAVRDANDNWTPFKPIQGTGGTSGLISWYAAAASENGELQVLPCTAITDPTFPVQALLGSRDANDNWTPFSLIPGSAGQIVTFAAAAAVAR
jgi:hypothetical protein